MMKYDREIPLMIVNNKNEEIFSIESDGTVNWMKNGKLAKVKTNKELSLAFALALIEISNQKIQIEVPISQTTITK